MSQKLSNIAKSIRGKLLLLSKQQKEDFNYVVMSYASERFLYRLSQSQSKERFILKGATLFKIWKGEPHRATKDLDLLGFGNKEISQLIEIFKTICQYPCEEDGLEFDEESVRGEKIKEAQEYEGVRITLRYHLDTIKRPIQIDIGFGDVIVPQAEAVELSTMLDLPAPRLRIYSRETVVAEKFQAMVSLGITNSRIKDFYDIWFLCQNFEFQGNVLSRAIKATFTRRKTELPVSIPLALSDEFVEDDNKQKLWTAFLNKGKLKIKPESFKGVINKIKSFLMPPCLAATNNREFNQFWNPKTNEWLNSENNK